jgi:ketosteroid isomerase-like protein
MKTLLAVAIVGLAIGFSMPAHAQNKDTVDPKIAQQRNLLGDPNALGEFGALGIKVDEAFKNNDAGAVAALFIEEGVLVASDGMFFGRQAIEKRYADTFQRWPITTFSGQRSCLNAIDNAAWAVGEWWSTVQSQTGPKFERGYWSAIYVREGDTWKIRLLTISDAPQFIGYSP